MASSFRTHQCCPLVSLRNSGRIQCIQVCVPCFIAKFSELSLDTGSSCCQCETYLMSLYVTLRPSCKDAQIAFKAAQCALSIQTPYYGEQLVSAAH